MSVTGAIDYHCNGPYLYTGHRGESVLSQWRREDMEYPSNAQDDVSRAKR